MIPRAISPLTLVPSSPRHRNQLSRLLRRSCTEISQLWQIHVHMVKTGLDRQPFPAAKLLAAAALVDGPYARSIFDRIDSPNLFHFNTVLRSYANARSPKPEEGLLFFKSLLARQIPLDQFSFISMLKACSRGSALPSGRQIHGLVLKLGFESHIDVANTLISFYCRCQRISDAHILFDEMLQWRDAASFGALMSGYLYMSRPEKVVRLFREMRACGLEVNAASLSITLSAASSDIDCFGGKSLHGFCLKSGFHLDLNVATAIVDMYAKSVCMDSATSIFDCMSRKDLVLYNCMVDGYAKGGMIDEAFTLICKMRSSKMKTNAGTFVGLLSACASAGAVGLGRNIHEYIEEDNLELDAVLGTALINMYLKNGCLDESVEVFNQMVDRDVKAWTAMIMGLGVNGQAEAALELFHEMEDSGTRPNEVTFLAILSACSHGGLVAAGKECFESMVLRYKLSPKMEHYGCLIDLLGRAGLLEEANELIKRLPFHGDTKAWRAVLAACRVYGNVELGELAKRTLVLLGDEHPSDSILLSSTYVQAERWADIAQENSKLVEKKEAGYSSIEMSI